ncbi:flagellar protein FliS [Sphingomonas cannabina]|uniref:flagellar export chaperone FliS n=1 Tax=Sphingomonas cannabina TaxID=2899123 RepID=UPI001F1BA972|nr:flagellar protein FliS [Sphingomonas cannabina]UIJ45424.1 flagellar protein FliS [Sphingomonas cannabina]
MRYSSAFARPEDTYRAVDLAGRTGGEDPAGLVSLLYAEASRALRTAAWAAEHRRFDVKSERVTRALSILFALEGGLDFDKGGEVSKTLARVYQGARAELVEASLDADPKRFIAIAETIEEIAAAWETVRRG